MTTPSSFVDRFRTLWATRFVDRVTITRTTDYGALNTTTGLYDAASTSTILDGSAGDPNALIRPRGSRVVDRGGVSVAERIFDLFLPASATTIRIGDAVAVVASTHDAQLVGKVGRVSALDLDGYQTIRRHELAVELGSGVVDDGT